MSNLKISVIILTYKNIGNLEDNIKSISKQSYNNYEIIIHDDGTPNFDYQKVDLICKKFLESGKYSIYTNKRNLGIVKNANEAYSKATGDILFPLSQDDVLYNENCFQKIVDVFKNDSINICTAKRIGSVSKRILPINDDIKYFNCNESILFNRILYSNFISGSTLYWRKNYFNKLGGFDEECFLIEDHPIILNIISNRESIHFINEIMIVYGESGVSNGRLSDLFINDSIKMYQKILKSDNFLLDNYYSKCLVKHRILSWKRKAGLKIKIEFNMMLFYIFWVLSKLYAVVFKVNLVECRVNYICKKYKRQ